MGCLTTKKLLPPIIRCRGYLQLKEDIELFEMNDIEELDVQVDHNYDCINVKVMCYDCFCQLCFLSFMNNIISLFFHEVESVDDIICNKVNLKISS